VIGIANTGSAYNPCHGNAPQLIEAVKRGILLAGGLPMEFPTISIHESFAAAHQHVPAQPDVHGHRGNDPGPADGCGGADRRLRQDGAGPADGRSIGQLPAIQLITGSMLTGSHRGERVGRLHRLPPLLGPLRAERD
jgi:dihydroxy-acid dehydratase